MDELKINETPSVIPTISSLLRQISERAEFLAQTLETKHATHNDVDTHITFIKDTLNTLSPFLEIQAIENKTISQLTSQLRTTMAENKQLRENTGGKTSAETLEAALRARLNKVEKWYEENGFEYARMEPDMFGFNCDFTSNVSSLNNNDKPTPFKDQTMFDIIQMPFRQELADTDKNKIALKELFLSRFPSAIIISYESRRSDDKERMALRTKIHIPYKDI